MEIHWHLQENDFFESLPQEREAFLSAATRKALPKNKFVFLENDSGDSCYYLERGTIKIFRVSEMGKEPIFFVRKSGEMFGLAEVIDGMRRKANAQTITPCVLYELGKAEFEELLSKNYALARKIIQTLGRRLRFLGEQVENLMVCDVRTRLLKLLFYMCCQHHAAKESWSGPLKIPLDLTQEQIASLTGSCQQTVSETLKRLQQEKAILISRKEITILNPLELLEKI
jgi:CRP-like cAMP-binding protein